jgi:hypothetical protein
MPIRNHYTLSAQRKEGSLPLIGKERWGYDTVERGNVLIWNSGKQEGRERFMF